MQFLLQRAAESSTWCLVYTASWNQATCRAASKEWLFHLLSHETSSVLLIQPLITWMNFQDYANKFPFHDTSIQTKIDEVKISSNNWISIFVNAGTATGVISYFTMENYLTKLCSWHMLAMTRLHTRGEQCKSRLKQGFFTQFKRGKCKFTFLLPYVTQLICNLVKRCCFPQLE